MKKELLTPDDTLYREDIICPSCGHIQTNREEYDNGTWDCGECGEEFELDVEVSVTYSTFRVSAPQIITNITDDIRVLLSTYRAIAYM